MASLQVSQLSFRYETTEESSLLLDQVSFDLKGSDRACIIGKNGSGKSTLLKIIAGLLPSVSETILLNKQLHPRTTQYKSLVAYIPDKPLVYDTLTGLEHMELVQSLWKMNKSEKELYKETFLTLCDAFDLTHALKMPVKQYSLGMRYKLFFNCMVARSPELIILDEPFTSLDEASQIQSISLLKKEFSHRCVLFTSHQRYLYSELGNRFFQLDQGQLNEVER
ncbi:ABC transporter ATP-binding protein [Bacillus pumilus]|uniref:ATP-binding cassette domain-containing protein n=1 Tax=Bacillus TaxID=1386 RepID=UPI000D032519|nr:MULTISPECIES: ABC transporter ATP-binding protein [Bacillus]MBU5260801.1 ABC transporter ATP-binding protein [Bacillus pumilus]MDG4727169.1 ABC transporter ATP-binding protein [Bacillus pumilus]PRS67525.1 ABC transporter ATP-binding protein [Bacillus sp. NMTD17]PSB71732.1 ABC transporter ATP-binding protein [Bacillus sp. LNXM12-1]PSB75624.1 ABC transporter ATP-binding protein [Bacillus sp. LNXM12-2]